MTRSGLLFMSFPFTIIVVVVVVVVIIIIYLFERTKTFNHASSNTKAKYTLTGVLIKCYSSIHANF